MAITYKILGQLRPGSAPEAAYTVPTGKSAIISSIQICNNDSVAVNTFDIYAVASGATAGKLNKLMMAIEIPAGGYVSIEKPITLGAGDSLQVTNGLNDTQLAFSVFGTEIA